MGGLFAALALRQSGIFTSVDLYETATTTHYFFATRRNHVVEDGDYNKGKIEAMHAAFENEDGPIIQAVQAEMDTTDFFSLDPVLMTNDVAPVKVRKLLRRLIEQGKATAANRPGA